MKKETFTCVLVLLCCLTLSPTLLHAEQSEELAIKQMLSGFGEAVAAKDLDKIMSIYAPEIVAYDAFPPREYDGIAAYRKDYEDFFKAFPGPVKAQIDGLKIHVSGSLAYMYGVDTWEITGNDGKPIEMVFRFSDVLEKRSGKWLIVFEHLSFPVDPVTGKADFKSTQ